MMDLAISGEKKNKSFEDLVLEKIEGPQKKETKERRLIIMLK